MTSAAATATDAASPAAAPGPGREPPLEPVRTTPESMADALRATAGSVRLLAAMATLFAIYFARPVLVPLAAAFLMTVALRPIAQRLVAMGVPRLLAAAGLLAGVGIVVVGPMIYGDRLRLNPAMLIASLALMGWAWGVPGAVMAVPLLVVFKAVCTHAWGDRPIARLFES